MKPPGRNIIVFYIIAFIIFIFIAIPGSVIQGDDFYFTKACYTGSFFSIGNDVPEKMPVENLWHVIVTQYYGYKIFNGRFIIHGLTQLFTVFFGYKAIIAVKVIFGMLILLLLNKICISTDNKSITPRLIIFACILIIMPLFSFGEYFSSNTLTFNYGMSSCASLLAIHLFFRSFHSNGHVSTAKATGQICLATLLGMLHEGFSIPMLSAMIIYAFINRRRMSPPTWIFVAGYFIGTIITVASPGNWMRLSYESGHGAASFGDILLMKLAAGIHTGYVWYGVLIPACIFVLLQLNKKYRAASRLVLRRNIFFIILATFTYLFAFASGILYTRPYALMGYSMVIICSQLLFIPLTAPAHRMPRRAVAVASAAIIVAITSVAFARGMHRLDRYNDAISQYKATGVVILDDEYEKDLSPWALYLGPYAIHPSGSPWVREMVAYYCSADHAPIKFMPEPGFDNPTNLVFENDSLKVYNRTGAWWIAIEGGNFRDKRFVAAGQDLFSDSITSDTGRKFTLVSKPEISDINVFAVVDSLGDKELEVHLPHR